jgi:hypothetical protein
LERSVVAFCNVENETHAKVNKQVVDLTAEDSSKYEKDYRKEDVNHANKNGEFNLDDDADDLESPPLNSVLSDRQPILD